MASHSVMSLPGVVSGSLMDVVCAKENPTNRRVIAITLNAPDLLISLLLLIRCVTQYRSFDVSPNKK
jgi:hypothetical protein